MIEALTTQDGGHVKVAGRVQENLEHLRLTVGLNNDLLQQQLFLCVRSKILSSPTKTFVIATEMVRAGNMQALVSAIFTNCGLLAAEHIE